MYPFLKIATEMNLMGQEIPMASEIILMPTAIICIQRNGFSVT